MRIPHIKLWKYFCDGCYLSTEKAQVASTTFNFFFGTFLVFPSGFNLLLIDKLMKKTAQSSSLPMQKL